jgi:zinc transport system substrate-binding protein
LAWLTVLPLLFGCDGAGTDRQAQTKQGFAAQPLTKRIVAVSYPLQWVTQQIAGDQYDVSFPGSGAADPATWRPDRKTIAEMQSADLIIANGTGATYAKWLTTVSLPESKLVSTASRGLALSDYIMVEDIRLVHSHGPEGEHSHPTMISETWLGPAILKKQAIYIESQLAKTYPGDASKFAANLKSLGESLDSLEAMKSDSNSPNVVVTATPQMKFLTRSLKIEDLHLNWNLKTSADSAKADLKELLEARPGERPGIIVFPASLKPLAERLASLLSANKLSAIFVDLLENTDPQRSLVDRIRTNIRTLSTAADSTER